MAEEKVRFQMRIDPDTDRKVKAAIPLSNSRYCDYLSARDCTTVLPPVYLSALKSTIQMTEDRISRLLFKLAVEMDMMMNVLAAGMEIRDETLNDLRGHCVQNVKKTNGSVSLEQAVRFQDYRDK